MTARCCFAVVQYLWLVGALLSAYGAGALVLDRCPSAVRWTPGLRFGLALAAGVGVLILAILLLAMAGRLEPTPIGIVVAGCAAIGAVRGAGALGASRGPLVRAVQAARRPRAWFWMVLAALFALPFLAAPLGPPLAWDELMYHLPQARAWVRAGSLVVTPELRFPLFPYNFDLLYAAALLYGNDVLPHLLHALAGWLVALLLVVAGARYFDRRVGVVAAVLFLVAVRPVFASAYNDLGLTLFVASAFLALALWYEGDDTRVVALAAWFFGLAIGTKLQGLLFAPLVAFWIVRRAPPPRTYAAAAAAFAAGAAFWYVRSFAVSGDPIHPFGGPLFGYWGWNRDDVGRQIVALRATGGPPAWCLWPAFAAAAWWRGANGMYRALCATGYAAVLLWAASSGYERYLMPGYPLLALLAASVVVRGVDWCRALPAAGRITPRVGAALRLLAVLLVASWSATQLRASVPLIAPSAAARDAVLRERLGAYRVFRDMPLDRPWRLYQFGFEGELYYAPVPVVGDWFGPHRYRRVLDLAAEPAALAAWLRAEGLNGLLVNTTRAPFGTVRFGAGFSDAFELVLETPTARLYAVRAAAAAPE